MKKYCFLLACLTLFSGCLGAYDTPVFVDIGNSETAFLIQVEGDGKQASTKSEDFLEKNKVQAKRVQIPYRWQKLGV